MAALCGRCEAMFTIHDPEHYPKGWYGDRLWGSYRNLDKAVTNGCLLCQDVRHSFIKPGVDLAIGISIGRLEKLIAIYNQTSFTSIQQRCFLVNMSAQD